MIIQDKNPIIGLITGGGFPIQPPEKRYIYPRDRLKKFLEVDPTNEKEIQSYCYNYKFMPRDWRKGFVKGFQREHKELKELANRLLQRKLTDKDKRSILKARNSIIDDITSEKVNNTVGYIKIRRHTGTIVSLYEDLINHVLNQQALKSCLMCGSPFIKSLRSYKHSFCSDKCRSKAHKRKIRKNNML